HAVVPDHDQYHQHHADDARDDAAANRVLTERGTDLLAINDLERKRQRTGVEHQRKVLRLLDAAARELDLAGPVDPAVDHRRTTLHEVVEHDRHVVADVLTGLGAEAAGTGAIELERHDRLVGHLVDLRDSALEPVAGYDRLRLQSVEEAHGFRAEHLR